MSPPANGAAVEDHAYWTSRTRVVLLPTAAPSILGLFGFAGATFIVSTDLAWGWGGDNALYIVAPFLLTFGGIAQFTAGVMAYRARDGLATAMHGMWGAHWIAYGLIQLFFAIGFIEASAPPGQMAEMGYWFIVLAAITFSGAAAATFKDLGLATVLLPLAIGSALVAGGEFSSGTGLETAGGYVLLFSALVAWYTATAMMLEETAGKVVLPMFRRDMPKAAKPGAEISDPIGYHPGMPGLRVGQ